MSSLFTPSIKYSTVRTNTSQESVLLFNTELYPSQIELAEESGVHFKRHQDEVIHVGRVYSARIDADIDASLLDELGLIRIQNGDKKFYPSLLTSTSTIRANDVWNYQFTDDRILGTGVRIAVIDTGVEWLHPSFWRNSSNPVSVLKDGSFYYADIDGDLQPDEDEGPLSHTDAQNPSQIDSANEYLFTDIYHDGVFSPNYNERWVAGIDQNDDGIVDLDSESVVLLDESKVCVFLDQFTDTIYFRGVNLTSLAQGDGDYHGHGTHVSSIALGGHPDFTDMVGVAPGADLIAIKSTLELSDIIEAIYFAIENDADVINMSFSNYAGYMDGTDFEELLVNEAFIKHGIISTVASGNLGGRPKHARAIIPSGGFQSINMQSSSPSTNSYINLLWKSIDLDEEIRLISPTDETIDLGRFMDIENSLFTIDYQSIRAEIFADSSLRGTHRLLIQLSAVDHFIYSGAWDIEITNPDGADVILDGYAWDNSWSGSDLVFTSHIDYTNIVSSPGTSDLGICVGNYAESSFGISSSSGVGPRIDGVMKPNIVAPGTSIIAASSSLSSLWITRSGTSMAAPHIAGVIALLKQASDDSSGWLEYTATLAGAGGNNSHYEECDISWGYGLCDVLNSLGQEMGYHENPTYIYRPLVKNLQISQTETDIELGFSIYDADSPTSDLSASWAIHDELGYYSYVGSENQSSDITIAFPKADAFSPTGTSLLLQIGDALTDFQLPPLLIDKGTGGHFFITEAYLETHTVSDTTQPLVGAITIANYHFLSDVTIGFSSSMNSWDNTSLAGEDGFYEFELDISHLEPGEYAVIAAAHGQSGRIDEYNLGTLSIEGESQSWLSIIVASLIALFIEPICRLFSDSGITEIPSMGKRISMIHPRKSITLRK